MSTPTPNPFLRLYKAAGYSCQGIRASFIHEAAFRLEVYILLLLVPLALWLGDSAIDYLLLIGSWVGVMMVELINSAIEASIDRIGTEHHELSGRAKDLGSAAVMISILLACSTWFAVLLTPD